MNLKQSQVGCFTAHSKHGAALRPTRTVRLDVKAMAGSNPKKPSDTRSAGKKERKGFFANIAESAGTARVRSETDRKLLKNAQKTVGKGKEGKMDDEQYRALRRKVGGTYRDFMKDWIEADEVESVRSSGVSNSRKGLPTLLTVVAAVVIALGVVLTQTKNESTYNPSGDATLQQDSSYASSSAASKAAETGV